MFRLQPRQWLHVFLWVSVIATVLPIVWKRLETLATPSDYRIPYELSNDYWLYERRADSMPHDDGTVVVLGDSVVWGEYVRRDGTLSHFLTEHPGSGERDRWTFVNAGVNGLFPLALEGLIEHYGAGISGRRVLLHCNLLWMNSPTADLSLDKEHKFNHSRLVPQFIPRITCYRADFSERFGIVLERNIPFFSWINHLQTAWFDQTSVPEWTMAEAIGEDDTPAFPNAWRSPLNPIRLTVPGEPEMDPDRGTASSRHIPWSQEPDAPGSRRFDWVQADRSLQWSAFQRLVHRLQERSNDLYVLIGPFNEHMMAPENRDIYHRWLGTVSDWLEAQGIPSIAPPPLPSAVYGDASHPLTEGYAMLAEMLWSNESFRAWITSVND